MTCKKKVKKESSGIDTSRGYVPTSFMGRDQVKESDKHDIIVQITEMIDGNPLSMSTAERIFESIRYDIAKYILTHEYMNDMQNCCSDQNYIMWIEEKSSPDGLRQLSGIINKYLK